MNIFAPGTYFTGWNRTIYPRSLYQYMGYDASSRKHHVKFYCLAKWKVEPPTDLYWPTDTFYEHGKLWYREAKPREISKYKRDSYCEPPEFYGMDENFRSKRKRA